MLSDGKRKLLLDFWNKFILKSKKTKQNLSIKSSVKYLRLFKKFNKALPNICSTHFENFVTNILSGMYTSYCDKYLNKSTYKRSIFYEKHK